MIDRLRPREGCPVPGVITLCLHAFDNYTSLHTYEESIFDQLKDGI